MSGKVQAAIIGCGAIGSEFADDPLMSGNIYSHAEAYVRCKATQLAAVCDIDPAKALRCAQRWNAGAVYVDHHVMLAEQRPQLVSICTPDSTHAAILQEVLHCDSVRGVLCEKPLATDLAAAERLVRCADERGVVLAVNHGRRYAENIRNLRLYLASGAIGTIRAVTGWYTKGALHNGSHWFDLLRLLAGEVQCVRAWNGLRESSSDPTLDVLLVLHAGPLATLRACASTGFSVFEMDVLASAGRVRLTEGTARISLFLPRPSERYSGYTELLAVEHEFGSFRDLTLHAVEDLVDSLHQHRPPACSGYDGLASLQIADAALRSAQTGHAVTVRE